MTERQIVSETPHYKHLYITKNNLLNLINFIDKVLTENLIRCISAKDYVALWSLAFNDEKYSVKIYPRLNKIEFWNGSGYRECIAFIGINVIDFYKEFIDCLTVRK